MRFAFAAPPIPKRTQSRMCSSLHDIPSTRSDKNAEADNTKHDAQYLKKPTIGKMDAGHTGLPVNVYHSSSLEKIIRNWNPEFTTLISATSPSHEQTEQTVVLKKECYQTMTGDDLASLIHDMVPDEVRVGDFPAIDNTTSKVVSRSFKDTISDVTNFNPSPICGSHTRKRKRNTDVEKKHLTMDAATDIPERRTTSRKNLVSHGFVAEPQHRSLRSVTEEERELVSILMSHLGEANVDTTDPSWFEKIMSKANIALRGLDLMLNKAKSDSEKICKSKVHLQKKKKALLAEQYQAMVDVSVTEQSHRLRSHGSYRFQFSDPVRITNFPEQLQSSNKHLYLSENSFCQAVCHPISHWESRIPNEASSKNFQLGRSLPTIECGSVVCPSKSFSHGSPSNFERPVPLKRSCKNGLLPNRAVVFGSSSQLNPRGEIEIITLD